MSQPQKGDLSENEKKLIDKCGQGSLEEVKVLLKEQDVRVDCLDESGMTPLQHAAFRNRPDIAQLLLSHGADVNSNYHENGYTALMFAALSGNPIITKLMLEHGARKDQVNGVGRNAAQMAAFVGQHQCVAVINNFFAKEDLEYYTKVQGLEKEPKLPYTLVTPMLKLLNMANMHPVKLSQVVKNNPSLLEESYKVCKVLDLICEKAMKSRDTDDVMAIKAHYFATLIRHAKDSKDMTTWIKSLLKGRDEDGYPEKQDKLIRQALKEFPYIESQLLLSMVGQLAKVQIGEHPSSWNVLMQGVNGQKFTFDEYESCSTCGEGKAERKCSACKMVYYCNQDCQKLHWFTHKKFCKMLAVLSQKMKKEKEEIQKKQLQRQEEQQRAKAEAEQQKQQAEQGEKTNEQTGEVQNGQGESGTTKEDNSQQESTANENPDKPKGERIGKAERELGNMANLVQKNWETIE